MEHAGTAHQFTVRDSKGLRSELLWAPSMQQSRLRLSAITDRQLVAPRRFIALVLSAALLHLSSARANAVCTEHGTTSGAPSAAHHETAASNDHSAHSAQAVEDEACETPVLPECCQALATCSITFGGQGSLRAEQGHLLHMSVVAALERAPLSRVATPDPPPPKL